MTQYAGTAKDSFSPYGFKGSSEPMLVYLPVAYKWRDSQNAGKKHIDLQIKVGLKFLEYEFFLLFE